MVKSTDCHFVAVANGLYRTCSRKQVMFLLSQKWASNNHSRRRVAVGGQLDRHHLCQGGSAELSDVKSREGQQPCRQSILHTHTHSSGKNTSLALVGWACLYLKPSSPPSCFNFGELVSAGVSTSDSEWESGYYYHRLLFIYCVDL